jgi:hypothetical protein
MKHGRKLPHLLGGFLDAVLRAEQRTRDSTTSAHCCRARRIAPSPLGTRGSLSLPEGGISNERPRGVNRKIVGNVARGSDLERRRSGLPTAPPTSSAIAHFLASASMMARCRLSCHDTQDASRITPAVQIWPRSNGRGPSDPGVAFRNPTATFVTSEMVKTCADVVMVRTCAD